MLRATAQCVSSQAMKTRAIAQGTTLRAFSKSADDDQYDLNRDVEVCQQRFQMIRSWSGQCAVCVCVCVCVIRHRSCTGLNLVYLSEHDAQRTWAYVASHVREHPGTLSPAHAHRNYCHGYSWLPVLSRFQSPRSECRHYCVASPIRSGVCSINLSADFPAGCVLCFCLYIHNILV